MRLIKAISKSLIICSAALLGLQAAFAGQNQSSIITLSIDPICNHYSNGIYVNRVQFQTDTPKIDFRHIPGVYEYDDEQAISAPLYVYANAVNHDKSLQLADITVDDKSQNLAFGIKIQKKDPDFKVFNIKFNKQQPLLYLDNKNIKDFDLDGLDCDVTSKGNELNLYCTCLAEN